MNVQFRPRRTRRYGQLVNKSEPARIAALGDSLKGIKEYLITNKIRLNAFFSLNNKELA
jgi:hypothetical protein